jgi:two-component system sensor histidine kinase SenX3
LLNGADEVVGRAGCREGRRDGERAQVVIGELSVGALVAVFAGLAVALAGIAAAISGDRRYRQLLEQVDRLDEAVAGLAPLGGTAGDSKPSPETDPSRLPALANVPGPLQSLERRLRIVVSAVDADRRRVNLMERAVRSVPEGLVLTDAQGVEVFRNDVAAELAGARHGDALVEAAVRELVTEAVRDGQSPIRTLDLYGPPRRTMVVSARPVLTDGEPVGGLALIADITEKRQLEAIRRDFVANISHELKTPVGALSLLAETLITEDDPQVTQRLAERMLSEATRLAHTIEDLLVLSRIESEEHPDREVVPVHRVVTEAVNRIRPGAESVGIAIDVAAADPRLSVQADRRQVVSALYNLLDNAVKYSDPDSGIEVRVIDDGRELQIAVEDHGIGIPAKDIERVFERFYRVDLARSRQTGGTGLGLSIVRHVMANHGGQVTVESRLGEGSTFVLRFPVAGNHERSAP